MSLPGGIEAFTVAAVEGLGGAVEPDGAALYTVLWPPARSVDVEARRLAFDPEALEDAPDAELVIFGSPVLDELVGLATASGRVARAFLAAAANPSRAIADRLARAHRFRDAEWAGADRRARRRQPEAAVPSRVAAMWEGLGHDGGRARASGPPVTSCGGTRSTTRSSVGEGNRKRPADQPRGLTSDVAGGEGQPLTPPIVRPAVMRWRNA